MVLIWTFGQKNILQFPSKSRSHCMYPNLILVYSNEKCRPFLDNRSHCIVDIKHFYIRLFQLIFMPIKLHFGIVHILQRKHEKVHKIKIKKWIRSQVKIKIWNRHLFVGNLSLCGFSRVSRQRWYSKINDDGTSCEKLHIHSFTITRNKTNADWDKKWSFFFIL